MSSPHDTFEGPIGSHPASPASGRSRPTRLGTRPDALGPLAGAR